eukprot:Opistho-2@7007
MKEGTLPVYNIDTFNPHCHEKDFYANTLSNHLKTYEFISVAHKHDFYLVVVCTKGSGSHWIDFVQYDVQPGSMFLLSPGQGHSWTLSEDIEGYIFFHSRHFYELNFTSNKLLDYPFYCSIYNSPVLSLNEDTLKKEVIIFKEIVAEYRNRELMKFNRLFTLVELLYFDVLRLYISLEHIQGQNQNYLIKVRELEGFIDDNYTTMKSPAQYAEKMFVTAKQLNRICKETLNKSTSDLIFDRIILEAKRLLAHSSFTIPEIAEKLGYTDVSYFSRLFRKRTGKTPISFSREFSVISISKQNCYNEIEQ